MASEKILGLDKPEVEAVLELGLTAIGVFGMACTVFTLAGPHRLPAIDVLMGFALVANVAFGVSSLKRAVAALMKVKR